LVGELLRASLNPLGDEILKNLIMAMSPEDALVFATGQQQFLPTLFRVNPSLAVSPQLWRLGGDRKRELFESIVAQHAMAPEVVSGITDAILESDSDGFIRRAFTQWGQIAIFEALDYSEAHGSSLTANCRAALSFHVEEVVSWIAMGREKSTTILAALAYVLAPYASRVAQSDTKVGFILSMRYARTSGRMMQTTLPPSYLLWLSAMPRPHHSTLFQNRLSEFTGSRKSSS